MQDIPFWKRLVVLNGLVPLALLGWDSWQDQLGANRVNYAIHITGIIALLFLVTSLAITPLRRIFGWASLIAYRRALGLYGFAYAIIHVVLYLVFDRAGNLSSAVTELMSRSYLQVGLASVTLMIPLAVTSSDSMVRRLGPKRWKLLHRLAYIAIALGGIHYFMLVKSDVRQPVAFLIAIGGLLALRGGFKLWDRRSTSRRQPPGPVAGTARPATGSRPKFWKGELKLVKIFPETPNVRTFRFVHPDGDRLPFDFLPGQYLNLRLSIDGQAVPRSYTIASSPTRRDYCEVTIKRESQGKASRLIHDSWQVGQCVEIGAPAGRFHFTGDGEREVLLVAGGVGITPVMSMLRFLTDRGWPGTIHFLLVVKSEADYIFRDELEYLARRFDNLRLRVLLTRSETITSDSQRFFAGRLTATRLYEWIPGVREIPIYLCGPDAMMEHTRDLLQSIGVQSTNIHTEAFAASPAVAEPAATEAVSSEPVHRATPPLGSRQSDLAPICSTHRLHFRDSSATVDIEPTDSILEGAEKYGVDIPYECRSGICGQCKLQLCEGKVRLNPSYALTAKERDAGLILACQGYLETDAEIKFI